MSIVTWFFKCHFTRDATILKVNKVTKITFGIYRMWYRDHQGHPASWEPIIYRAANNIAKGIGIETGLPAFLSCM